MQILKEAPECYIQQCKYCGAVLKYSECDILPANKSFDCKDENGEVTGWGVMPYHDSFECPVCHCRNEAKRKWLIE